MLTEIDVEKRLSLWEALSKLFLDTELDTASHRRIAAVIVASGYKPEEVHHILWREVFPAVGDNLRSITGEWAGFDSNWLKERILSVSLQASHKLTRVGVLSVGTLIQMTQQEWSKICNYLPSEFSLPLLEASQQITASQYKGAKAWWQFW